MKDVFISKTDLERFLFTNPTGPRSNELIFFILSMCVLGIAGTIGILSSKTLNESTIIFFSVSWFIALAIGSYSLYMSKTIQRELPESEALNQRDDCPENSRGTP